QRRVERTLKARNDELGAALRFAEQFIGLLGHDLRNPLSAITTAAGLLRRRAASDKVQKPAERILNSAERMSCMVDQLLDFTRIRSGGGLTLEPPRVALAEFCRIVVDEVESPRLELTLLGEAQGDGDAARLAQVVTVLTGNALTHGSSDT